MKIKKSTIAQYSLVILYILFSGLLILLTESIVVHIISILILFIGSAMIVKFDISHPFFWYSFVFVLYAISYPIVYLSGITYDIHTYTKSLMLTQWMALSIILLIVGPQRVEYKHLYESRQKAFKSKPIMMVMVLIILLTLIEITTGNFTNKAEIYGQSNMLVYFGFRAVLILLILYTKNLVIEAIDNKKIDIKMTFYVLVCVFLLVFFSGERDLLIRFFISFLFVYYILISNRKLSKLTIFVGSISIVSIPLMAQFKYFGLTGTIQTSELNIFLRFLTSEFQSASKNLQIILLDISSKGMFMGETLISSLLRSLKIDQIINLQIVNSGLWFNNEYFSSNRAGQGFTLIGEGYINFGYFGVILLFIFVGLIIRVIYRNSKKGVYCFTFYILSIPVFMYSLRADLANIISPLLNQNLLTLLIAHNIMKMLNANKLRSKPSISLERL